MRGCVLERRRKTIRPDTFISRNFSSPALSVLQLAHIASCLNFNNTVAIVQPFRAFFPENSTIYYIYESSQTFLELVTWCLPQSSTIGLLVRASQWLFFLAKTP